MATYASLIRFTEQGMTHIQDSPKRAGAVKSAAKKLGAKVKEIYWLLGAYDGLVLFEAPDEETATAFMLHVTSLGNVHTQTMRAFDAAEMEKILPLAAK